MPRKLREKSGSGIYHVMMRGVNRQNIFEDDRDRFRFIETIKRYKGRCNFNIFSYCLMNNHVHLLMKENEESVSKIIQRMSTSYVYWYNNKYERSGHLFEGRFKSEPVDSLTYFLTVIRYIHQNPVKAGLAKDVLASKWTSANDYFTPNTFIDTEFLLNQLSLDRKQAIHYYTEYMQATNDDQCLDDHIEVKVPDTQVKDQLAALGIPSSSVLQKLDRDKRNAIISELKRINGVSAGQLSRITGISKSVIVRVR
ncbi:transposase [Ornithinibacillus salinisoli]|uniref:Transposase n=1 Tax=Ornithinibacillus salinisoli TaxID=1848459 RepID=A0ABW4W034_9BACI